MATTLAVTNTFVAGSAIVAAQVNTNFSDIVTWATTTPNLSVSGSNTTIKGTLTVDEVLIASDGVHQLMNLKRFCTQQTLLLTGQFIYLMQEEL